MSTPSPRRRPHADCTGAAGGRAASLPADTAAESGARAPQPVDEATAASTGPESHQLIATDPPTVPIVGITDVPPHSDSQPAHRRSSRWPRRLAAAALGAGLVALGGGGALALGGHPAAPAPVNVGTIPSANTAGPAHPSTPASISSPDTASTAPNSSPDTASTAPSTSGDATSGAPNAVMAPIHLQIPAIKVDTSLTPLSLQGDGAIAVPTNFAEAGWYSGGTLPGDPGPAVVLGHVDSFRGPAVFYRLPELRPGDVVSIQRLDDTTVRFAVDALREFPKNQFPTDLVYGDTAAPTLRLITCGGSFDRKTRSYLDNVVVFAHELSDGRNAPVQVIAPTPAAPAGTGPAAGTNP